MYRYSYIIYSITLYRYRAVGNASPFPVYSIVLTSEATERPLYMAVFFIPFLTCPLYTCTVAYTGQVTFYTLVTLHLTKHRLLCGLVHYIDNITNE